MYAIAFSGFYWAMLVILAALMFRPLAFDYRSKVPAERWRSSWDWLLFVGSAVPPIICGVAFGNLLQGVPLKLIRRCVRFIPAASSDCSTRSDFSAASFQL